MQATENNIFQSTPIQIKALLKAVGWTRYELGRFVGVFCRTYTDKNGYTIRISPTVQKWTSGKHVPGTQSKRAMLGLVQLYQNEYLLALENIRHGSL